MGKKIILPLLEDPAARSPRTTKKKPSLDDARARLGGRGTHERSDMPCASVGQIVHVTSKGGARGFGVVLFANAKEAHVLEGGVRLRRLAASSLDLHHGDTHGDVPEDLVKIAADARVFGSLAEGQPVRYADDAVGLVSGKLVEKCRYGALVVRDDGTVIAVGFRKLWPASGGAA